MRPLACALAILAAACTSTSATSTSPAEPATTPPTTTPVTTTTPAPPADPCPTGEPGPSGEFATAGSVASFGTATGDAAVIAEIRVTTPRPGPDAEPNLESCERLVVDLATERGAPATAVGSTQVELLPGLGIVRISLPPAVAATAVADVTLAGTFAQRAFVVDGSDGVFVDVHLGRPAVARADATRSPATIIIDLVDGGAAADDRPAAGANAAVLSPLGPTASYPLEVTGYARSDGPPIEVMVTGNGTATEPIDLAVGAFPWQAFTAVVPSGPSGNVRLTVGEVTVLLAVP